MRNFFWKIWWGLVSAQKAFLIAVTCFLIVFITSEVIMRYVIHYPGMEVEELATMIAFWFYFIGGAYGTFDRSHIKAEMLHLFFKDPRKIATGRAISTFIALCLCGLMVYWAGLYVIWGITKHEKSRILNLPMVYSQVSIFIGAILMFIYFLAELIDRICQALGKTTIFKKEE